MLVDKPSGITSHDVVQRVRRQMGVRAAGHTGTLDPFATGLLVILVGPATRLARFVEGQPKTYLATARLGTRTDTDDLTGAVTSRWDGDLASVMPRVAASLAEFSGAQPQRPPAYSAKHVAGARSYQLARQGRAATLPEVDVIVHRIELLDVSAPEFTFRCTVSAGTYVRAIARDLGERLGVGGHLVALRREAIGALSVDQAIALEQVAAGSLRPVRSVLAHLPSRELDDAGAAAVGHGRAVSAPAEDHGDFALMRGEELVAVARAEDGWLRPSVVLVAS